MAYLRLQDYYQQIQSLQLNQITGSDNSIRLSAEYKAIEELRSYLVQKYDMDSELTDTSTWSNTSIYKAKNRIYLDANAYSASSTYAIGALVLQSGNVYRCLNTIGTPEAFTPANWTLIGAQYDLFFVKLPNPEFDYLAIYSKDDQVFWKDKVYTAQYDTPVLDHDDQLQIGSNADYYNFFPDDPINGSKQWGTGVAYSVAAGTLPTDTTKWTAGDNRSQKIMECLIDISLYKIHSRIAPNNTPQLRIDNYDAAIMWLKNCGKGIVTANVPVIQPKQGRRIRFGGNVKNTNSY